MAPPRVYRCQGLTLRKAAIGEADLVVTVFTAQRGKLRAVAKGARRPTSKLVGHLEPLTLAWFAIARGRQLDIISQAQVLDSLPAVKEDLPIMARGLYIAELLDGFGPETSPSPGLYRLAGDVLRALPGAADPETLLRYFEFHLLRLTGMMPELYQCVECGATIAPDAHRFSVNLGGVLCPGCAPPEAMVRPLSLRAMKVLRLLRRGALAETAALSLNPSLAAELKNILSGAVRYWLGKEIRSAHFLDRLQDESRAAAKAAQST